jgi:hypothetical protein
MSTNCVYVTHIEKQTKEMGIWMHLFSEALRHEFILMLVLYGVAIVSSILWCVSWCIPCCGRLLRPMFGLIWLLTIVTAIGVTIHTIPLARSLGAAAFNAGEAMLMEQVKEYQKEQFYNRFTTTAAPFEVIQ